MNQGQLLLMAPMDHNQHEQTLYLDEFTGMKY